MWYRPPLSRLVIAVVAVFMAGWSAPAFAQRQGADGTYTVPRTPDGHPDLQGFWTNQTYVPLERPDGVDKPLYTEEEVAERERASATREAEQTTPGTIPDVHYDITQFGLDRSQSTLTHTLHTSLIIDPQNGRLPPVNAEGRKRAEKLAAARAGVGRWDSAEANELDDRCIIIIGAGPPMVNAYYNANYHIVQNRDYVMILVEMIHDARIIPLDGRDHPHDKVRQWMGLPRGRWEGDTLVVETADLNGKNPFNGSSDQMRVTERFTRVDADTIVYRFTVEDPATWDVPWTAEMPMKKARGPIFEYACHEGNRGLYNTLVGARLEERLAAEEAARQQHR